MRYSRFRATVTGHEPQKRGRHGEKDRVSKPSKRDHASKKDAIIKSESGVSLASLAQVCSGTPVSGTPAASTTNTSAVLPGLAAISVSG